MQTNKQIHTICSDFYFWIFLTHLFFCHYLSSPSSFVSFSSYFPHPLIFPCSPSCLHSFLLPVESFSRFIIIFYFFSPLLSFPPCCLLAFILLSPSSLLYLSVKSPLCTFLLSVNCFSAGPLECVSLRTFVTSSPDPDLDLDPCLILFIGGQWMDGWMDGGGGEYVAADQTSCCLFCQFQRISEKTFCCCLSRGHRWRKVWEQSGDQMVLLLLELSASHSIYCMWW